jgi:HD superfamily phosphohydrolase
MDTKTIYDNIHGYIIIKNLALRIIDTPEFQRLRNIKQLGTAHYVFPGAIHTRFEHSIGVYHLAGLLLDKLKISQPELKLSDRQIELVKIGGLVHDLGHGPFSHMFDDDFIGKMRPNSKYKKHEYRSIAMLKHIINKYNIDINKEEVEFITSLIMPKEDDVGYIYQIISNKVNSIDVDKFDYIC